MLSKHLPIIFLLEVAFVESSHHGVVVNDEACSRNGGHLILNDLGGTITSPLHPNGPPTPVFCSWLINNTHSDTLILSFGHFDLNEDVECSKKERDCCNHQWLQVEIPEPSNENYARKHRAKYPLEDRSILNLLHSHLGAKINPLSNLTIPNDGKESESTESTLRKGKKTKKRRSQKTHFNTQHHNMSILSNTKKIGHLCGNIVPQPITTTASTVVIKFYSDGRVHPGHMGFVLHYQITNNKTVCKLEEFNCGSPSLCIPESWQCNGQKECPDGLDETNCLGCAGITESQRCDGLWHCQEGQDELGCFDCSADEWSCGENDECYKKFQRCNGKTNCHNGVDEAYCNCGRNQSRCSPNSAYCYDPLTQRCDGVLVCPGGEDEMDCGRCGSQGGLVGVHMIACSNGEECYSSTKRCDGVSECRDGSDEHNCSPQLCHPKHGAFLCANSHCIRDAWRCDQFDDCGDASDEDDCLRNSVIVAAAMGGLVCSLLLVIAVGCTCRLYALRLGLNNRIQTQRGIRRSTQLAPLTRLEQHLLQREPPPSYSVAVNDPSASLFGGSMCLGRGWRRQRRRAGGLGSISSDGPLVLPVPSPGYQPEESHIAGNSSNTDTNTTGSPVLMSNEKERGDGAKVLVVGAASRQTQEESQRGNSYSDDDVPLLSAMTDDDDDYSDEDLIVATNDNIEDENDTSIIVLSTDEQLAGTADTSSLVVSPVVNPMPGSSHRQDQCLEHDMNANFIRNESTIINLNGNEDHIDELPTNAIISSYDCEISETSSQSSEVTDNDTQAAVLALSVVRHHTERVIAEATDTELITQ